MLSLGNFFMANFCWTKSPQIVGLLESTISLLPNEFSSGIPVLGWPPILPAGN